MSFVLLLYYLYYVYYDLYYVLYCAGSSIFLFEIKKKRQKKILRINYIIKVSLWKINFVLFVYNKCLIIWDNDKNDYIIWTI